MTEKVFNGKLYPVNEQGHPMEYCGDGVYAIFDGYGITLHINSCSNPTDKAYLEPEVLTNLNNFYNRLTKKKD